ncbi:MAG: sensor histidine kinase [Oligoflexales bacterium]
MNIKLPIKIEKFLDEHSKRLDVHLSKTKALLFLWLSTVTVMWLYVAFCYHSFEGWGVVTIGGIIFTIIHSLAPIVFYKTGSLAITGMFVSFTGLGFQTIFCLYSGGIFSPAAIWFSLHPVILAFFANIPVIMVSVGLNAIIVLSLYLIEVSGYLPQDNLSESFRYAMNISSYLGLDILIAVFTIVTVYIHQKNSDIISAKKEMIENLVRILSHDLCNPLTVSKVQVHLFKKGKIPAEDAFDKVDYANHQIFEIINSVRYWMAHQENKLMLKTEEFLCTEIIEHVDNSFSDRMGQKGIKLIVSNELDKQQKLLADKSAVMFQIINNAMSNAIKFTPEGTAIKLCLAKEGSFLVVSVADNGTGIDEELKQKIFSPYEKTSKKGTGGEAGTGFGMPIIKTLMEKMEGEVTIDNWYDEKTVKGAIVTLRFPDKVPIVIEPEPGSRDDSSQSRVA